MKRDVKGFKEIIKGGIDDYRRRRRVQESDHGAYVEMSTSLASYYILEGIQASSRTETTRRFEDANNCLNDAEKRDQTSEFVLLRKGLLLLAKGSYEAAEYQFTNVLQKDSGWLPAKLGLACVQYCSGNFKAALGGFQSVLRSLPNGPPSLRLVIGHCMAQLGFIDAARTAYTRANELAGRKYIDAIVAIAVLNLNEGLIDRKWLQQGLHLLKEAYSIDKSHPVVLTHLGNHFFFKKEYTKAEGLLKTALTKSMSDLQRSETLYVYGKIAHVQGKFDEALRSYAEAASLNPRLTLAQYALGQCYIHRKEYSMAVENFEKVLKVSPDCLEAKRALGLLLAETKEDQESLRRAEALLTDALSIEGLEEDKSELAAIHISLASISGNPEKALTSLTTAQSADPEAFDRNPALLNNLSVLKKDIKQMEQALEKIKRVGSELYDALLYNKARLLESSDREIAKAIYTELASKRPAMVDVHLRLGLLCPKDSSEAQEHFKDALGQNENCIEAWALLATAQLRQKALGPARKAFERLLQKIDRHDSYSLVALGNIYIEIARSDKKSRNDCLKRAAEFFSKALSVEPKNPYAAAGLGILLAEHGQFSQAKEAFLQVRLAEPTFIDVTINLANCFVELGQPAAAIPLYESVLASPHIGHRVRLGTRMALARALYIHGKIEKQPALFTTAISCLSTQQVESKLVPVLEFNAALCHQENAACLIKKASVALEEHPEVTAITSQLDEEANSALDRAKSLFESLRGQSSIDQKLLDQRLSWVESLRSALASRLDKVASRDRARQAHLEALAARRAQEQAALESAKASEKAAWEAEQASIEQTRREMSERLRMVEEKIAKAPASNPPTTTSSSAPRKRRSEAHEEYDDREDDDEEMPKRRGRLSRGKPSALSKDFISSDDENLE